MILPSVAADAAATENDNQFVVLARVGIDADPIDGFISATRLGRGLRAVGGGGDARRRRRPSDTTAKFVQPSDLTRIVSPMHESRRRFV